MLIIKVAIISDIHGNMLALDAVLNEINSLNITNIICAGDFLSPLKESKLVWERLKRERIPTIRGNHEDRILNFDHQLNVEKWDLFHHNVTKCVAEDLDLKTKEEIKKLSLSFLIKGPNNDDLFICHGSPHSNEISFYDGIDQEMEESLLSVKAQTIISGHRHDEWSRKWKNKLLISFGSVGMPIRGNPDAQFIILEYGNNKWNFSYKKVKYNHRDVAKKYLESGWVEKGAPMSLLLYQQLLTGENYVGPFMEFVQNNAKVPPESVDSWKKYIRNYLIQRNLDRKPNTPFL